MGIKQILRDAANNDDIKELRKLNYILNIKEILGKKTDVEEGEIKKLINSDANVKKLYEEGEIAKNAKKEVGGNETLAGLLSKSDIKKAIIKDIGFDSQTTLDKYLKNPVIIKIITDPELYKSYKKGFNVENIAKRLKGIKMSKTMELKELGSIVRDNLYKDKDNKAQAWLTIFGPALKNEKESKNVAKINKYLKNKVKKIRAKFIKYSFFEGPQKMNSGEVKKLAGEKNLWQFIQDKKIVDDRFLLILYQGTDSITRGDFFDILKDFFNAVDETISKDFKKFLVKIEDVKTFTSKKALHKLKISMLKACELSNNTLDAINNEEKAFDNEQDEDEDEKIINAAATKIQSLLRKYKIKKNIKEALSKTKDSKSKEELKSNIKNVEEKIKDDKNIDEKEKKNIMEDIKQIGENINK